MHGVAVFLLLAIAFAASAPLANNQPSLYGTHMDVIIARILAQIKAEQSRVNQPPPSGVPNHGGNIGGPPTPTGPFPSQPTARRLGEPHLPRGGPGMPKYFSQSHEHHVNEGNTIPHRHFDFDSRESHERWQDAQDRADGKVVPPRALHPKHVVPHNGKMFPHWSSSHEHHVNEGNKMPPHRHNSRGSRESHEFFLRRQALADNRPAPTLAPVVPMAGRPVPEVVAPVINYGHRKHKHWYDRVKHFSSSHEHHVNEGNQMKPHRHFSRESLEEHQFFLKQQQAADRGFTVRPPYGAYNSDESDGY